MKMIILVMTFWFFNLVHADTRLLIRFDGDHHEIVKVVSLKSRGLVSRSSSEEFADQPRKAEISFQTQQGESTISINDPRVLRAPMSQDGYGHEHFLIQQSGFYTVTLKQDDIDLSTLSISLPGHNKTLQLKLKQ